MRLVVCVALLASAVVAFDCDGLKEPVRTKCLDRAAEMHIQMAPAHDGELEVTSPKDEHIVYDDAEDVDDVMGDLGEAASSRAQAKANSLSEAQMELKVAEAQTQGMYDDDIKIARAFSDLDDDMDDLKSHVRELHSHMRVADTETNVRQEYEREEAAQKKLNDMDLGESDSISASEAHAEKRDSMGVLDASADDLAKDLTVDFHQRTAPSEHKADALMQDMAKLVNDDEVSMLDTAEEF